MSGTKRAIKPLGHQDEIKYYVFLIAYASELYILIFYFYFPKLRVVFMSTLLHKLIAWKLETVKRERGASLVIWKDFFIIKE